MCAAPVGLLFASSLYTYVYYLAVCAYYLCLVYSGSVNACLWYLCWTYACSVVYVIFIVDV